MIYTDKVHMVADSLKELHEFAQKIGLHKRYYEGVKKKHPHYDLVKKSGNLVLDSSGKAMANRVISEGAKLVTDREILLISKKLLINSLF